jgi:hypothetical protein
MGASKLLMALVLAVAFPLCVRLFQVYASRGKAGVDFPAHQAEKSGDYEEIKKAHFLFVAIDLLSLFLVLCIFMCGASSLIPLMKGKSNGDIAKSVLFPASGVAVVLFLIETAIRIRICQRMRRAARQKTEPALEEREYRVCYTANPARIDKLMMGVVSFVTMLPIIGFLISLLETRTGGIVAGVIDLLIIARLLWAVAKEHRDVRVLLVIDRSGILDQSQGDPGVLIPWRDVSDVHLSGDTLLLILTEDMPGVPGKKKPCPSA